MSEEKSLLPSSNFMEEESELFPEKYSNLSENVKLQCRDLEEKLKTFMKELEEVQATLPISVKECVKELRSIADGIDLFHRNAIIAGVVGSSVGIAGGITTIVGLALAPVTFGASLIVTLVGGGVATAGGITGAASSIADSANIRMKGKRVEEIIQTIQVDIAHLEELLKSINAHIEDMKRLVGLQNVDITRAGAIGVFAAVEITSLAQLANVSAIATKAAHVAAWGAKAAAAVSGVIVALFMFVDIAIVAKGAKDLKEGAKVEQAKKIRAVADELETEFEKLQAAALEVDFHSCATIKDLQL
ncbi:apolipoprotein L6 [Xenopus laevis]|uniref:Apolipoprotein L6 n=2 Tax=Xenopus laevis TaxID=8355 RepID=A0A8J0VEI3_XENLA|nr:apolipoprotein L6 [Xenopus laevis]